MIVGRGKYRWLVLLKCEDCGEIREVVRTSGVLDKAIHRCTSCWNKFQKKGGFPPGAAPWNKGLKYTHAERRALKGQ